jgi:nitrilase
VQIYVAPTWDRGDPWLATMRHIALEGRTYVVGCCIALHLDDIPDRYPFKRLYAPGTTWINSGDSVIVAPDGTVLAGPLRDQYGILYADVDMHEVRRAKWMLDVAGHYARPDVFRLEIDQTPRSMLVTTRRTLTPSPSPAHSGDKIVEI